MRSSAQSSAGEGGSACSTEAMMDVSVPTILRHSACRCRRSPRPTRSQDRRSSAAAPPPPGASRRLRSGRGAASYAPWSIGERWRKAAPPFRASKGARCHCVIR